MTLPRPHGSTAAGSTPIPPTAADPYAAQRPVMQPGTDPTYAGQQHSGQTYSGQPYPEAQHPGHPQAQRLTPEQYARRAGTQAHGSVAAGGTRGKRKHPLAWLPLAILGTLAALALLGLLLGLGLRNAGGDADPGAGSGLPGDSSDEGGASGAASGAGAGTAAGGGSGAGGESAGQLTAGNLDLLADPTRAASAVDRPVAGKGVLVQEVVADEGFWVGSSAQDRVFVFLEPSARQSSGESRFQVEAGQRIDVVGTVRAATREFGQAAGVTSEEGLRQLADQGAFVSASAVRLSR